MHEAGNRNMDVEHFREISPKNGTPTENFSLKKRQARYQRDGAIKNKKIRIAPAHNG